MHKAAQEIIGQIMQAKQKEISTTEKAREMSLKDAQDAEGAMISRYDTFLEEAQYLAGAQSKRLLEARAVVELLRKSLDTNFVINEDHDVSVGDLFVVENVDTNEKRYYIMVVEGAGGSVFQSSILKKSIASVTTKTPVGQFLIYGEEQDLPFPGAKGTWEIVEVL